MRESKVERDLHTKRIKRRGGISLKFVSPGRKNVPDRLDLLGMSKATELVYQLATASGVTISQRACREWAKRIVAASVQFTETKATGKGPNAGQQREHVRLRAMGYKVNVVDG